MRIVVIGATGHIGTFLVPRLVRAGHDVVAVSRGTSTPYADAPEWTRVERVVADREQEDRDGTFGDRVAALAADAVVDLVCFTVESADSSSARCAAAARTWCTAARSGGRASRTSCRSPRRR